MNITAIVATKRRNGSVSSICTSILDGAAEKGHTVETVNLHDHNIAFCAGCRNCSKDGRGYCVLKDDFNVILDKIKKSDVIVLGSPLYWGNVSAIMKNLFDRHMSVEYLFPGGDEYASLPFLKKLKVYIREISKIHVRPDIKGKRFIIVTALTGTWLMEPITGDIRLFTRNMMKYINGMKGRMIKRFVCTDTLFKFKAGKMDRLKGKAYEFGKSLK